MSNSIKKTVAPQEIDADCASEMDDFDFESLDELATFMVGALTIPMPTPTGFRGPKSPAVCGGEDTAARPAKRLN